MQQREITIYINLLKHLIDVISKEKYKISLNNMINPLHPESVLRKICHLSDDHLVPYEAQNKQLAPHLQHILLSLTFHIVLKNNCIFAAYLLARQK